MPKRKTKYTMRPDGTIELTKTINGKRKHFYGHSDEEVEAKRDAYIAALEAEPEKMIRTFAQAADDWWEKKEPELSPNTVTGYKSKKERVSDALGEYLVTEITPFIIISYLRRLAAQGYSQKSIVNIKAVIKGILDDALIAGEIISNPCLGLPVVKGKKAEERLPASEDDVKKIEANKTKSLIARMHYFMLYTGCRRGEAAALQQKHINTREKTAHICQTLAYTYSSPQIKPSPKTAAGVRDVDLYDNVLEILPQYKDPETFIFFPNGLPTKKKLEIQLTNYRKDAGISCTPHQLRHSYASMLHSAGIDAKDAQALLGHSSILVTQDIYTKLESKHKAKVQKKINRYINRERRK